MDGENVRNLAFANMLDTMISNVGEPVNPAIIQIYERNSAVYNNFNNENVINLHQGEVNIEE